MSHGPAPRLAMLLPTREGFAPGAAGAVSLDAGALVVDSRSGLPEVPGGHGLLVECMPARGLEPVPEVLSGDDACRRHLQQRARDDRPFVVERLVGAYDSARESLLTLVERR